MAKETTHLDLALDALRLFNGPDLLELECLSFAGFDTETHYLAWLTANVEPGVLHRLLDDDMMLSIAPARTYGGRQFAALPVAVAVWRPSTEFLPGASEKRHIVKEEAQAHIAAALASMPPASVVVDAGPIVWAGWCLEEPIVNHAEASELVAGMATRLGGDPDVAGRLHGCSLPLAGRIRNWNAANPEPIRILTLDVARRFRGAELVVDAEVVARALVRSS